MKPKLYSMQVLRVVSSGLLAAGLVAGSLGLDSSGAPPATAAGPRATYYADDELPAYPDALEYPLGEDLAVNGLPFRLSHFSTPDPAAKVRDYYLAVFEQWKAPAKVTATRGGGFNVTATVAGGATHVVVAISPRKGSTEVFPSAFPLSVTQADPVVDDQDVPFSPSAVGIMKLADRAKGGETFSWQEPTLSVAAAAAWLKDELPKRGWNLARFDLHGGKGGAQVSAVKGERRLTLHLSPYRSQAQGASVMALYDKVGDEP